MILHTVLVHIIHLFIFRTSIHKNIQGDFKFSESSVLKIQVKRAPSKTVRQANIGH